MRLWLGHLISGDKSNDNFLVLVGDSLSGKSIIKTVVTSLFNEKSIVCRSVNQFTEPFDYESIIGRSLLLIENPDFDYDPKSYYARKISAITCNAPVKLQRPWGQEKSILLPMQILVDSKTDQWVKDFDVFYAAKYNIIKFSEKISPDVKYKLGFELGSELPLIRQWAIQGYIQNLADKPHSDLPQYFRPVKKSPGATSVQRFINRCCNQTQGKRIIVKDLFRAYCQWAKLEKAYEISTVQTFGKLLKDVIPGIRPSRGSNGKGFYRNIEVKPDLIIHLCG